MLTSRTLIDGAKGLEWRLKWQSENPKRAGSTSGARYGEYCGATTSEETMRFGAIRGDFPHDLRKRYLQIFPESLRVAEHVAAEPGGFEDAAAAQATSKTTSALLKEYARMRLVIPLTKGDLRDLNNWRDIVLLNAASKALSMVTNQRLQKVLRELGIEE